MECPICFNLIYKSCIGSCCHHFCYKCLLEWCKRGNDNCPLCKVNITEIKLDKEFDSINNPNDIDNEIYSNNYENNANTNNRNNVKDKKIVINYNNNDKGGVTLVNNTNFYNQRKCGVKVKSIDTDSTSYKCGLRKNNVLLFLNNIPCYNHNQCIKIFNHSSLHGLTITCELLK